MNFVSVWSYDNYVSAHLAMGRLKEEGFNCWLKDENTVTIDPILTNAVGGIKLMVAENEAIKAHELLNRLQEEHRASMACPYCGSHNIELVSSPRRPANWISAFFGYVFGAFAFSVEKEYHCFACEKEFEEPVTSIEDDKESVVS